LVVSGALEAAAAALLTFVSKPRRLTKKSTALGVASPATPPPAASSHAARSPTPFGARGRVGRGRSRGRSAASAQVGDAPADEALAGRPQGSGVDLAELPPPVLSQDLVGMDDELPQSQGQQGRQISHTVTCSSFPRFAREGCKDG
jgi:hypothetical protein